MADKRLKKLTALLLSIVMVFSMVTEAFPAAFAAEEAGGSMPQAETPNYNFSDSTKTRRPGLYVDFLGDNGIYQAPAGERDEVLGGASTVLNSLVAPGKINQSSVTNKKDEASNPDGTANTWAGYHDTDHVYGGTNVFWVGVGVSRMNLLDLFEQQDNGIYGLELGFYYDSRYIEPYTGAAANDNTAYRAIIEAANLTNYKSYQWNGYRIVDAQTDLIPQTDPVTQEVLQNPDMDEIMGRKLPSNMVDGSANPWRMTYVSIERTNVVTDNRFKGSYNAAKPVEEDLDTQYLLLIPFKLKEYDEHWQERVCLRLARSAGLLSIGGGDGDTPYTAWERVTTRNPDRELKLMTDFQGDLNIFSGGRYLEKPYNAHLIIEKAGGEENKAELSICNDPSPNPVVIDQSGQSITGLYGGTGMGVKVHVATGYKATVEVYYSSTESNKPRTYIIDPQVLDAAVKNDGEYVFIMPEADATVRVTFEVTNAAEFRLYLDEKEQYADRTDVPEGTDTGIRGNSTVLTATHTDNTTTPGTPIVTTVIVDKDSSKDNSENLPSEMVRYSSEVRADIKLHGDYEAVVWFTNTAKPPATPTEYDIDLDAGSIGSVEGKKIVLSQSGTIILRGNMPASDVIAHVTYRPAEKRNVILEVHHQDVTPSENNVAQLWTTVYTKDNQPQDGYSGVVYQGADTIAEPDQYRQVKDPFRVIDRVDISSATGSGSLGGDGRSPMAWSGSADSLMALLAKATKADDLKSIMPLDLRWDGSAPGTVAPSTALSKQPENGIRKNALGERYTDQDITDFYDRLWELKGLTDAAIGAAGPGVTPPANLIHVPASGGAAAYDYYDLSWQQVQAYILDYEARKAYEADQAAYDTAKAQYDVDKAAYDKYLDDLANATAANPYTGPVVREPKLPRIPVSVDPPALRDQAGAERLLSNKEAMNGGKLWYEPSAATDPPTVVNSYELQVRPGRKMAVVLEAGSTYTVAKGIKIKKLQKDSGGNVIVDGNGNPVTNPSDDIVLDDASGKLVRSAAYQNEFLFDMPDYDCIVEVTYTERKAHTLELQVVGDYDQSTPPVSGNNVTVTGYGPNTTTGSITAAAIDPLTKDKDEATVLEDSTVSILVHVDTADYDVQVRVDYDDASGGAANVATLPDVSGVTSVADGTLITFRMPAVAENGKARVVVTYTSKKPLLNAHLRLIGDVGSSSGYWNGTNLLDTTAHEGDALKANISVAPKYYIYAVEAHTASGAFPITLSGNGWNNGQGGAVTIDTTMPDEDYWVYVEFRQGPPEPEPGQFLTLRVNDPDNAGPTYADNWAQAEVYRDGNTTPVLTMGPLKKTSATAAAAEGISQRQHAKAGDRVKVIFTPADGYVVESVEIQPAGIGASPTRVSGNGGNEVEFTMPAASATVVVTFKKKENVARDPLYLHLNKTENGAVVTDNRAGGQNHLISVVSPTIDATGSGGHGGSLTVPGILPAKLPSGMGNTGVAQPGELVELRMDAAPGWYIHSLTVSGNQGRVDYDLWRTFVGSGDPGNAKYDPKTHYSASGTGTAIPAVATFIMPESDVSVTVHYRKGPDDGSNPDPDPGEHEVELVVEDPENVGSGDPLVYGDNFASAVVSGIGTDRNIAAVGKGTTGGGVLRRVASARAGEEVIITYSAAGGYALEIILVTPSGLHVPVNYLGGGQARFTMPDSSVTAIVRFKGEPAIQYTANLVLHFPSGTLYTEYDDIGEGSFLIPGTNGLDQPAPYPDGVKLYSRLALPGTRLDFDMLAHDGFYIRAVDVGPQELGVPVEYTGSFGRQNGYVIMPAANIQINVYFEAGWPDDIKTDTETVAYDLTLEVYDASGKGSTANFDSIAGTGLSTPDSDLVGSGESRTVEDKAYDEDRVVVKLNPAAGCYAQSITVTDSRGKSVPWQYVPGGIAFEMVPAHVTVTVKYAELPEPDEPNAYQDHTVRLHVGSANGTGDVTTMGTVDLTGPSAGQQAHNNGDSFTVTAPPQGQILTLTVTPNTGYYVTAAYAVSASGEILPLAAAAISGGTMITRGMPQVYTGGTVTFAMPDEDADVYVVFGNDTDPNAPDPDRGDLPATLTVVGPNGSGSAVMDGTVETAGTPPVVTAVTTGTVAATGTGSLFAPQETRLTVDLTVASGFGLKAVRVVDIYGQETPYVWTNNDQRQFTLTMPAGGVHVYVELEEIQVRPDPGDTPDPDSQLTVQVVVNNGGNAGNTALLRCDPTDGSAVLTGSLLSPVYAGDRIHLEFTVQPGYRVEYVKVVPAKYGLLPRINVEDPSFLMPGEDVVVYVKFADDGRDRKNVTLKALSDHLEDTNDPIQDMATIENEDTKIKGDVVHPVTEPNSTQIQAGPVNATQDAEWVVVDYGWAAEHAIKSLTVKDLSGNPVPFTQVINDQTNRKGQIRFPMVDSDVTVTIVWGTADELPKFDAVLHVIDLDDPAASDNSWGKLTWGTDTTGEIHSKTQSTAHPDLGPGEEILQVPAGEKVRVDAFAQDKGTDTPTYIQAAYVLYRVGGQMISFNLTPDDPDDPTSAFTGAKDAEFIMHPGQCDVYIYYTKVKPEKTDYAAVLMLDSPETYDAVNGSKATITRTPVRAGEAVAPSDTVTANDAAKDHGYVTATVNDTITVTVTPATDYSIESILMTPLGTSTDQGGPVAITRTGNTYTFTMPSHNVAVRVKLKKGDAKEYKATLHYKLVEFQTDGSVEIKDVNMAKDWARASYTKSDGSPDSWRKDGDSRMVPEGNTVKVEASITATGVPLQADYVLAAYVLNEKGALIPFGPALEGLTEKDATPNPNNTDGEGSFAMPGEDVHIYVWFTNEKPANEWHTAVLTVVDSDPNAIDPLDQVNSGLNSATIRSSENNTAPIEVWSSGVTGNTKRPDRLYHKFIWVTKDETVTIKTAHIESGYSYVNTTLSNSISTGGPTLTGPATDVEHTASYVVGECNTAVVVEYKASPVTRNPLNVVLIDRDNPGDGKTINRANVAPTGMTALDIASYTSAGARQRIPDVQSGIPVNYTAVPQPRGDDPTKSDYTYIARLKDSTGQDITPSDWTINAPGRFTMPNGEATLEITYFKARKATLVVQDTRGIMTEPDISSADMTENAFGGSVTASSDGTKGIFAALPGGTVLTAAGPTMPAGTRLIGVLVTDAAGTRVLTPDTGDGMYRYMISDSDAEIRMVVGPESDPNQYLASVSAVNLPAGTQKPGIAVTVPGANATHGDDWTVANAGNTLTVTVKVPYGYKAVITSADVTLNGTPPDIEINGPANNGDPAVTGTAEFTMPAKNVHVTVTYTKTRFTATIQTAGTGSGSATLAADGGTPVNAPVTISNLLGTETLNYTATPNTGSTLTRILMTTAGGVTQLLPYADGGGTGTFSGSVSMPSDDVTITVFFDDDNNRHHIAYVTVVDPDNEPLNTARDIQNTTSALGGGVLWAYGDKDHGMLVTFSVAPGYTAVVTAEYADGSNTPVSVTQQGSTGNATATLTMPDADVKVTITYSKTPPTDRKLKLRLVGHGQVLENQATLYVGGFGSSSFLTLNGTMATSLSDLWSTNALTVQAGTALDLDAGRHVGPLGNYIIERATIGLLDSSDLSGQALIPGTEVDIPLNEYGTTATGLHYMPDADAVVTVYYRLPYTATLFVVDANGDDYNDGNTPPGPKDTTADHTRVPNVTMSVNRPDLAPNNTTTMTHDPIEELDGSETVTTQVDKEEVTGGTMPDDAEIASVIASTRSGTVHLTEDTTESTPELGVYKYSMANLPSRRADDAEITVVLREKGDSMHTATVYKVGHDNKAGNTAAIANPTHPTLPSGTIWTGAYKDDEPVVTVTTEPGYYAIVTAVQTVAGTNVPVLQWTTQGTAADPIVTKFKMPDADVDVTVEYVKDPPKANMTLTLKDHDGKAENKGDLYKDAAAVPDPVATPSLTPFLSANGGEAVTPPVSPSTDPTITDPFSKTTTTPVDAGDYLALVADHGSGHYIKSITFQAAGFTFDMLNPPTGFVPRVPVSGGEIIIEFAPGKQSGRPFDPEHSERYYGTSIRLDPADNTKLGNYVTGDTTDGNPNPDLSVAPKEEQQGWILAESPDPETNTVVVTVPTLYDEDTALSDTDALADAGVDPQAAAPVNPGDPPLPVPPTYKFYWWDKDKSEFVLLVEGTDYTVTDRKSLDYAAATNENPKGDYPRDADGTASVHHYGYRLTLQVVDGATSDQAKALKSYIENGGEIYVTATRPGTVPFTPPADNPTAADPQIPWVESEKTQIIIKQDNVLKPYDPDNVDDPDYEDHWIRAENRGDYLLVTVPMLNNKAGDNPTEVDGTKHRLQLHLQVDGTDRDSTIINVSDLLNIQNVRDYENFWNVNLEYDSNWKTDPNHDRTSYLFDKVYENEIYYHDPSGDPDLYHGARFAVSIKDPTSTDPLVEALKKIFDNEGTMNGTASNYRMYITSDEVDTTLTDPLDTPLPTFRKDDYTDFEVPRYYSLAGVLQSWAPTHIAELTLYKEDTSASAAPGTYLPDPWLMLRSGLCETMSSTGDYPPEIYNGHWSMDFAFKSSELVAEDGTALTYQMVVEKTAHLTYTHTDIVLDTTFTAPLYDSANLKFSFAYDNEIVPISLFCGDIAPTLPGPNQIINDQDRNLLAGFNYGTYAWNDGEDDTATDWGKSTYNPYSYAYMADLNGDGIISEQDMAILMSEFNWKRRTRDYGAPTGLDFGASASGIMLLADFLDGEAAGDEAAEGGQPSEDADLEEGADPEESSDSAEGPKDPENPDGTENPEDPDDTASEEPGAPEDPEGAEGTDTPEDPEEPVEPESPTEPVIPEDPIEPEDPTEPESPDEPKDPDTPEVPEESTDPVPPQPETDPDQTPADPETPSESKNPVTSDKPEDSDPDASSGESVPETPDTEDTEPKKPDAEGGGAPTLEQNGEGSGEETADPTSTTDPDQLAEKIA